MAKPIQDKSLGYEMVRMVVQFFFPRFFRTIEVRGTENIPENAPVIFAANHQNGLMDPLAIILHQKDPVVYMARADIFSNPVNRFFLRFLKVAPVYRIRDGYDTLAKNEKQLRQAVEVLLHRRQLGVMPEGNHGEQHKLRPLVKGLFRIAFQAESELQGQTHVQVVPVGIDYGFYQHAGADLLLSYGRPLSVEEYMPAYLDNPAVATNQFRDDLAKAISAIMLDIRSQDYERAYRLCCYGVTAWLAYFGVQAPGSEAKTEAGRRFDARIGLTRLLDQLEANDPTVLERLDALTVQLRRLPTYPNATTEWMESPERADHHVMTLLFGLVTSPALLLNLPAWALNRWIVNQVEDKQMHMTFVFTLGVIFNLGVYLCMTLVLAHLLHWSFYSALVGFLMTGTLGILGEKARQHLRVPFRHLLYSFGRRKELLEACRKDFRQLTAELTECICRHYPK